MKTAFRYLTTTVAAICLAVIVVGCSADVSDNVAELCNAIDECTDMIAKADNTAEAQSVLKRYDDELSKYADDTTELTEADREAVLESLTGYVNALSRSMIAQVATTHPRYADIVKAMAEKKKTLLDKISVALNESSTLGEFVTRSSQPDLTSQNRSER